MSFRGIEFSFVFDNDELHLIAPADKSQEIRYKWLMKETGKGVYVNGDPLVVEEEMITGICNETNGSIIFLPKAGSVISCSHNYIGNKPPVLRIDLLAYVICHYDRDTISRITFTGPEINYIHPVNQTFSWTYDSESSEQGIIKIETRDFSSTTSKAHNFIVDEKMFRQSLDFTEVCQRILVKRP